LVFLLLDRLLALDDDSFGAEEDDEGEGEGEGEGEAAGALEEEELLELGAGRLPIWAASLRGTALSARGP